MQVFDVLIIGAGPAGSFAAEHLARGGARVALFDGRPPAEPKACGGGVTTKALKAWPQLKEAAGRLIDEVQMYAPSGKGVRLKLDEPFAIYSRRALDSFLRERARRAGAQIYAERANLFPRPQGDGEVWTVRNAQGERWQGRFLLAADGANSRAARTLAGPLPPAEMEVAFGYRAPLPKTSGAPTVIAFLPRWAGYAWAFPRLDHLSFGIATTQDAFDHEALDRLLWKFMINYYRARRKTNTKIWAGDDGQKDYQEVKDKLDAAAERYAARIPGLSSEMWQKRRTTGAGWALLGDAAGFADPVTGEGIYYALRSAEVFAETYLNGRASDYEQRWRQDFGRELIRAAQMRRRFYGTFWGAAFTDRMIELARAHPGVRRTLRELVAGEQGYSNLKSVLVQRAAWPF